MKKLAFVLPLFFLFLAAAPSGNEPATHNQQLFVLKTLKPATKKVGLMISAQMAADEEAMTSVKRAAAGAGFTIYLAPVETIRDVAPKFRDLRGEGVEAIWVIEGDGVMADRATRSYLIENTARQQLPLLAPTASWVSEGACASVEKGGAGLAISLNEKVLSALSLNVPESLKATAQMLATN